MEEWDRPDITQNQRGKGPKLSYYCISTFLDIDTGATNLNSGTLGWK